MDLPADWTPADSVALLLVGLSMIDGEVDDAEIQSLLDVLRGFPGMDAATTGHVGQRAYRMLWTLQEEGGDLVGTLRHHGALLGNALETTTLQSIHERLVDMADADAEVHPMEARLLQALRSMWELD